MKTKIKRAFTLAEIIVVLALLGTVAAITIPNAVRKPVSKANRVKIKKAMSSYDSVIQKMVIEHKLYSTVSLNNYAIYNSDNLPNEPEEPSIGNRPKRADYGNNADYRAALADYNNAYNAAYEAYEQAMDTYDAELKSGHCENIRKYFNVKEVSNVVGGDTVQGCLFKTGDGLWWDTTTLSATKVGLKREYLLPDNDEYADPSDYDDKKAFLFKARVNSAIGSWYTNDRNSYRNIEEYTEVQKIYDYINNKETVKHLACNAKRTKNCVDKDFLGSDGGYFERDNTGKQHKRYLADCDKSGQDCNCEYNCEFEEGGPLSKIISARTGWDLRCKPQTSDKCSATKDRVFTGAYSPDN